MTKGQWVLCQTPGSFVSQGALSNIKAGQKSSSTMQPVGMFPNHNPRLHRSRALPRHPHLLVAFPLEPPLCAEMEPTVSASIEAARAPIMGASPNGSDSIASRGDGRCPQSLEGGFNVENKSCNYRTAGIISLWQLPNGTGFRR